MVASTRYIELSQVQRRSSGYRTARAAFTLIELLAVVVVMAILVGISLGVVGFIQRKIAVSSTRAQVAAIESALESYKSDWGYYPRTLAERVSADGYKEATNNWYLYRALTGTCSNCTKKYMSFTAQQLRVSLLSRQLTICDPWGTPYNYYNSPSTLATVNNALPSDWVYAWPNYNTYRGGYSLGGQVRSAAYDLFSYGPDTYTFVKGAKPQGDGGAGNMAWWNGSGGTGWTSTNSASDDITNWDR